MARCVGDARAFVERDWTRAPLHSAGADPGAFADLFSLDDVDRYVASSSPRLPAFRLVKDGTPLDPSGYTRTARVGGRSVTGVGDPGRIFDEFRAGATIVFQGLQRSHPPLTRFCRALELELSHAVQANAYITPAGSRGLGVHYDTHDVFVLQLAGTKAWSIHEPVLVDPLPSQPWKGTAKDAGEAILSVELAAGDCLYVPRGFLHSARAQDELSAHLTIGVLTTTWYDIVGDVLAGIAEEPEFRRALPAGYATGDGAALVAGVEEAVARLRKWLDGLDGEAVGAAATRRFLAGRPLLLGGQLAQIHMLDRLGDGARLRRREGSVCHLVREGDTLTVVLGGKELHVPAALEPVMTRIAGRPAGEPGAPGPEFRLDELADLMDGPSRLVLGRRLVAEGLLEIVAVG